MLMLTDTELTDILFRVDNDMDNWRDRAKLRQHIQAQAARIAQLENHVQVVDASNVHLTKLAGQLRAEVDAHDAALQQRDAAISALKQTTQAPPGWHKLFMATPTLPIEISVNGVPIPLHNGASTEEM